MSTPHRCPVCQGAGKVESTLYQQGDLTTSSAFIGMVDCRSCYGTGVLWESELTSSYTFNAIVCKCGHVLYKNQKCLICQDEYTEEREANKVS